MNGANHTNRRGGNFSSKNQSIPQNSPAYEAGSSALPANEQALIREFMQALAEEIEAITRPAQTEIVTV